VNWGWGYRGASQCVGVGVNSGTLQCVGVGVDIGAYSALGLGLTLVHTVRWGWG